MEQLINQEVKEMSKQEIKPLVTIENTGKYSRVYVLGVDISRASSRVDYHSHSAFRDREVETLSGDLTIKINMEALTELLLELTNEDFENMKAIVEQFRKKE